MFDSDIPGFGISIPFVVTFAIVRASRCSGWSAFSSELQKRGPVSGEESIVGGTAVAMESFSGHGKVWLEGESWQAESRLTCRERPGSGRDGHGWSCLAVKPDRGRMPAGTPKSKPDITNSTGENPMATIPTLGIVLLLLVVVSLTTRSRSSKNTNAPWFFSRPLPDREGSRPDHPDSVSADNDQGRPARHRSRRPDAGRISRDNVSVKVNAVIYFPHCRSGKSRHSRGQRFRGDQPAFANNAAFRAWPARTR